ncbi:DNA-(apurinic or apyrimidinic site) lyase [Smittium culicis]|uniref:DNA-(apurinic or apyrimidinic site) endonuclease n=1 Tax=Smittium culicis TaxID=133412 RepID=A0A1R1XSW9_9FUNG|nr:DNA-(apurinic or apyrimidinic site) lyase [Smittium culicis]OMJ18692.1 DNA-(apurinic or apyrimidinic site) lyase [Smittium culicis]
MTAPRSSARLLNKAAQNLTETSNSKPASSTILKKNTKATEKVKSDKPIKVSKTSKIQDLAKVQTEEAHEDQKSLKKNKEAGIKRTRSESKGESNNDEIEKDTESSGEIVKAESKETTKSKVESSKKVKMSELSQKDAENVGIEKKNYPNNKVMPTDYSFIKEKPEGCLKIVSYNVNSLSAAIKKGFKEYVKAENPDILCLQETKLNTPMAFLFTNDEYPYITWNSSTAKKGYSGTAVFSKIKPLKVSKKLGIPEFDNEGRFISLEFETFYLVAAYVPNSGMKLDRLDSRREFDAKMNEYLTSLEKDKPVIYTGDLNVSHNEIDLARPDTNHKTAGFTDSERKSFSQILETNNRVDTFRAFYPDERIGGYSFYGYRFNGREKLTGWRLDYFVVSSSLFSRVKDSFIRNECYGASDHVPIVMYLSNE